MTNSRKLKAARIEKGLSQTDVSKSLNIAPATYSLKECGKRDFTQNEISILADLLELDATNIKEIFLTQNLPQT